MNKLFFCALIFSSLFLALPTTLQASEHETLQPLQLYVMPGCPYCKRVEDFLKRNNIPASQVTIISSYLKSTLINLSGDTQVPFLWNPNANKGMLESLDIIAYLSVPANLP